MEKELPNPLLTPALVARLGAIAAELFSGDVEWIHRRKELVEMVDDTTLRRQISVDFTLPRRAAGLGDLAIAKTGDCTTRCVPLFLLEKLPSRLMGFDLRDEGGRALSLLNSGDNGRITAAALQTLARRALGHDLPKEVADRLDRVAMAPIPEGYTHLSRLRNPVRGDPHQHLLRRLFRDRAFLEWAVRLADSSIVLVLTEMPGIERQIIKLTYFEPLERGPSLFARLGWSPFVVTINSPFSSASTFHLEIVAPPGLRVSKAEAIDEHRPVVTAYGDLRRRVHLYFAGAGKSGGVSTRFNVRTAGPGFVGGALAASLLVPGSLFSLAQFSDEVVTNPAPTPALLLLLPGVITSYVNRADRHALTSRMLSGARGLLLISTVVAFATAARIAVDGPSIDRAYPNEVSPRADHLATWFYIAAGVGLAMSVGLAASWVSSHPRLRAGARALRVRVRRVRWALQTSHFTLTTAVRLSPEEVDEHVLGIELPRVIPTGHLHSRTKEGTITRYLLTERRWWHDWRYVIRLEPHPIGTFVSCHGQYRRAAFRRPLAPIVIRWRARQIRRDFEAFAAQAA